jgi:hypothetical protein
LATLLPQNQNEIRLAVLYYNIFESSRIIFSDDKTLHLDHHLESENAIIKYYDTMQIDLTGIEFTHIKRQRQHQYYSLGLIPANEMLKTYLNENESFDLEADVVVSE